MDMFAQLDSMDAISMCGLKEEDWYIPAAKQAMKEGTSPLCRKVQSAGL